MSKVPVIVFNTRNREYEKVGEHSLESDFLSVLEKHVDAIAKVFGDEPCVIKPHDYYNTYRAVRLYDRKAAVRIAAWNFEANNGMLYNLPEPVSVEDDPIACVKSPDAFFPEEDSKCWCIPGFYGDNERMYADYPDELKDFISETFINNIGEWTNRISDPKTRKRAEAEINKPEKQHEIHVADDMEYKIMMDYLDACYESGRDTSFPAQAQLADKSIMAEYLETIGDSMVSFLESRYTT